MVARTLGTGVSQRGNTASAKGILRTIFPSQHNRGDGGGDDPNPSGGGGGGGGPNPAGGANAADPGALLDKMIGKEPEIFTGD